MLLAGSLHAMSPPPTPHAPASEAAALSAPPCITPTQDPVQWFNREVHTHDGQLKAYLRRAFPGVRGEVEDITQESYLRIWKRQAVKPIESVKNFLFQIARRLAVDNLRHQQVAPMESLGESVASSVMDDSPNAAELLSYHEKVSLVAAALTRLPDRCREIFILRKFKGVSQKDIAAQLGISERTVESQITRGMKLLENDLRAQGLDGFCYDEKQ